MISKERAHELRKLIVKASASLPDADALNGIELYDTWSGDSVSYAAGVRLRYNVKLYKVLQAHVSQPDWTPDVATSLYAEVEKPGEGDSPDNPINYNNNMELVEGKYYAQDGVVYICFRSTGVPVYNPLSTLVEIYVRVYAG